MLVRNQLLFLVSPMHITKNMHSFCIFFLYQYQQTLSPRTVNTRFSPTGSCILNPVLSPLKLT
jgi:hypothetical protein